MSAILFNIDMTIHAGIHDTESGIKMQSGFKRIIIQKIYRSPHVVDEREHAQIAMLYSVDSDEYQRGKEAKK
jgi:hypothetical protein